MKLLKPMSVIAVVSAALSCACPADQTPRESLISQMEEIVAEGNILYGHQDTYLYGHDGWKLASPEAEIVRSDIKDVCGHHAAVFGTDLGMIELGAQASLDKNYFESIRKASIQHHLQGGIVTYSWHLRNPLTGGDSWDVSSNQVVASILPQGEKHELFMGWLKNLADFLDSLRTEEGNRIPVIWRPWHEHTGSWFWWGQNLCTTEEYKALWKMTYDYLATERGLDNLVWAYSPGAGGLTPELFAERYPGDDIVDLVGFDCYQYSTSEQYIQDMQSALDITVKFAKDHGKLAAVTETGFEGIKEANWWTQTLHKAIKDYPIVYVLTWRNACDDHMKHHFYGPYPGHESAEDFKAFAADSSIIMLNE